MAATYKENEMMVYKITVQLEQTLKKEKFSINKKWMSRLSMIERQLQTRKFRIAVVGEFNRGKTSFINVLLGKKILPEDVVATTATINRITYGEIPRAYLIRKDGKKDDCEIPVEGLIDYVTKLTESSAQKASEIQEAVVEYPTMFCYHDVDLIDTPGMNDMDNMNEVTVNQLEDIDLAVVAINAEYPYSETENKFVVKLLESKNVCQILFVITHFDMLRDREKNTMMKFLHARIKNNVRIELEKKYKLDDPIFTKYHKIFGSLHIYGVSSIDGMEALETNNRDLYEKSGFLQLAKELPQVILSSKSVNMMDNIVTLLEEVISDYKKYILECCEEIRKWDVVKEEFNDLFASMLIQLEEAWEDEIPMEAIKAEMQSQKEAIVKALLNSLGNVSSIDPDSIQKVMLPVMQLKFKDINAYYQERKKQLLKRIYEQKWTSILSYYVALVDDKLKNYPQLKSSLGNANESLYATTISDFIDNISGEDAGMAGVRGFVFCWAASPVQAVLETPGNKSVLPGIQRIIDLSMEECLEKIKADMRININTRISVIKNICETYIKKIDSCIIEGNKNTSGRSTLQDLEELQNECKILHSQIVHNK